MTGCYTCGGGLGKHDPVAHGDLRDGDEPCMCGTDFTCFAEVHWMCGNCGDDLRTCDCDES